MATPLENITVTEDLTPKTSILRKLIWVVLVGIATTVVLTSLTLSIYESTQQSETKTNELLAIANVFATSVADPVANSNRIGVLKVLRAIGRVPAFRYARVEDIDGKRIAELGSGVVLKEDASRLTLFRTTREVRVNIVKGGMLVGTLMVVANTQDVFARWMETLLVGIMAAFAAAVIGLWVAYRLQRRITEPIRELTRAMSHVQQTQSFTQLAVGVSNDETGVLVNAFNNMMRQIRVRDENLAQHRRNLEREVEERTHQYREARDAAERANEAKSGFLATMSHEIRTPMNGMLVMAELLASANLPSRYQRYAEIVMKSGKSLLTIINDILDLSKIEAGKLELEAINTDPGEVVDDVLSLFWERATSKGVDIASHVARDVPSTVWCDPVRLNQILSNLVNNALKFTESGYVAVAVECLSHDNNGSLILRFAVRDTGIGIAEDKLEGIFQAFSQADQSTTRRFGGTGLGLAICKRLVEAMGGELTVTSEEGKGSQFAFTIATMTEAKRLPSHIPSPGQIIRHAAIAVNGSASSQSLVDYLRDMDIAATQLDPNGLTSDALDGVELLIAEPAVIAQYGSERRQLPQNAPPYHVCISQIGEVKSDSLLADSDAQDVLMRPFSRTAVRELTSRLEQGAPLGSAALRSSKRNTLSLPDFSGTHVLVADDSPVNREVLHEALKRFNITMDFVSDGRAAVDMATRKSFDLIFMDCSMPEMDGFQATTEIRKWEQVNGGGRTPVIALTAHMAGLGDSGESKWRQAGMDEYMTKPFKITDLVTTLSSYLSTANKRSETAPAQPEHTTTTIDQVQSEPEQQTHAMQQPTTQRQAPVYGEQIPFESSNSLPVIDHGVLDAMRAFESGPDSNLQTRVLGLFTQHAPEGLENIKAVISTGADGELLARAAHALKSMCRNIGAVRLGESCTHLELAARRGTVDNPTAWITLIERQIDITLSEITAIENSHQIPDLKDVG